jgi:hypothetical protein
VSPASRGFLAIAFLLTIFLLPVQTVGAQGEPEAPPGWSIGLAFVSSILAIGCSALGVVELSIYPKVCWMLHGLAVLLLFISYTISLTLEGFGGPMFWITTLSALVVAVIAVSLAFSRAMVKKLLSR